MKADTVERALLTRSDVIQRGNGPLQEAGLTAEKWSKEGSPMLQRGDRHIHNPVPHSLRHGHVTAESMPGASLGNVQLAVGHSTAAMTRQLLPEPGDESARHGEVARLARYTRGAALP